MLAVVFEQTHHKEFPSRYSLDFIKKEICIFDRDVREQAIQLHEDNKPQESLPDFVNATPKFQNWLKSSSKSGRIALWLSVRNMVLV